MLRRFNLLGPLEIEIDGQPSELLKHAKGCGLVAYLIVTRQAHPREAMADLLWEATSTAQALRNLRTTLGAHPRSGARTGDHTRRPGLPARPRHLRRLPDTPRRARKQPLPGRNRQTRRLDEALALYRGDLLARLLFGGCPALRGMAGGRARAAAPAGAGRLRRLCQAYLERQALGSRPERCRTLADAGPPGRRGPARGDAVPGRQRRSGRGDR